MRWLNRLSNFFTNLKLKSGISIQFKQSHSFVASKASETTVKYESWLEREQQNGIESSSVSLVCVKLYFRHKWNMYDAIWCMFTCCIYSNEWKFINYFVKFILKFIRMHMNDMRYEEKPSADTQRNKIE